jgi:hypothetical protein
MFYILRNIDVYILYHVLLRFHPLPEWDILMLGGQSFLCILYTVDIYFQFLTRLEAFTAIELDKIRGIYSPDEPRRVVVLMLKVALFVAPLVIQARMVFVKLIVHQTF